MRVWEGRWERGRTSVAMVTTRETGVVRRAVRRERYSGDLVCACVKCMTIRLVHACGVQASFDDERSLDEINVGRVGIPLKISS